MTGFWFGENQSSLFIDGKILAASALRSEVRKNGQYLVSDALVRHTENADRGSLYRASPLEAYRHGDIWFEVMLTCEADGHRHLYAAILEEAVFNLGTARGFELDRQRQLSQRPVLIDVPEAVENPERVGLRFLRSAVWLHRLDDLLRVGRHALEHPVDLPLRPIVVLEEDWELGTVVGLLAAAVGNGTLPDHLIQGRPEIMDDLTDRYTPCAGRCSAWLDAEDVASMIEIDFVDGAVYTSVDKRPDLPVKEIELRSRPHNLQGWAVE